MRILALACVCLVVIASAGRAQTTQQTAQNTTASQLGIPLVPGMRVRVTAPTLVAPLVVNYLENKADTLLFFEEKAGRGIWSLTLDQITKLEVTRGEKSHHRQSVVKYGVIGGAAGALAFGYFAANSRPSDKTRDYGMVTTGAVGLVVGAGIGAYLGSRLSAEKWRPITLPKKLAISPDMLGRWHLSASLTF